MLQVIEKLVVMLGVGLAIFPLWAWLEEAEDRAITRSAMRLAAYEYCFRILTKQQDLVFETLQRSDWTPAAIEAAAYADEIAEEECGLFHELAEGRVAPIAPPIGGRVVADARDAATGARLEPPAPQAAPPTPPQTAADPEVPAPPPDAALIVIEESPAAPRAEDAAPAVAAPSSAVAAGASDAPPTFEAPPIGRLSRGDLVILEAACGGEAIALSASRVMCSDGSVRSIDPESHAPIKSAPLGESLSPVFVQLAEFFAQAEATRDKIRDLSLRSERTTP